MEDKNLEWNPHEVHLNLMSWSIVQTIKKHGKWFWREVSSGEGGWDELVFELATSFGQFKDELMVKNRHRKMETIAARLEGQNQPYEFMMPDGTDGWYYAYCKPAVFRIDHEGKLQ